MNRKLLFLAIWFLPSLVFASPSDWNSNTDNGKTEFHIKWINWLDQDGFKPINTDFATSTDGFVMLDAPFKVKVPLTSIGMAIMFNDNRWDVFGKKVITDAPLTMGITALGVNNVPGRIVKGDLLLPSGFQKNVNYVIYENAYSEADLIYYVDFGKAPRLEKLVKIKSVPTKLSYDFQITYSKDPDFDSLTATSSKQWSKNEDLDILTERGIKVKISFIRGIGFKKFQIWDSNPIKNIRPVQTKITLVSPQIYKLTKFLPLSFFSASTTYPVYTDTVSTFFPDPDIEVTSVDGFARRVGVACDTFANLRGGTGTSARDAELTDENSFIDSRTCVSPNFDGMMRGFFLFDTSSIPDTDVISAATFSMKGASTLSNQFSQTTDLVLSSPASNTALAGADFEGTVNNTVLQSDTQITTGTHSTTVYNDYPLNATGLTNISQTGITKLGLRQSGDRTNTAPTWSAAIASTGSIMAETAGTGSDPKLVVTHAAVAAAVTAIRRIIIIQ